TLREGARDGELALGVRPEHVELVDEGVRGEVFGTEYMGTMQIVTVNTKHGQLKARLPSSRQVRMGEQVGLRFRPDRLVVFDNLAFPLLAPARRVDEGEIRKRVQHVAQLVRIDHKLANSATRLSGGEMQRVAIGRALIRRPAIYLMDEPLSSLDAKLRADLR